ncbi:MAG: peptidoglycan-binding protein [Deltaproteobacteria bacterium]|nr:MAG: peptidoglycan-binding protein [Deltaproteobacteria bacterium]
MTRPATGQDILDFAVARLGARYVWGSVAPKDDPQYFGPYDCAEVPSHAVYQKAGILYGCDQDKDPAIADAATYFWGKDARYRGLIITSAEAAVIPGAVVLRLGATGGTGHIAICDGQGGTVEAYNADRGVIRNQVAGRRWTMGIMVPGIKYQIPDSRPPALPPVTIYRLTSPRMTGETVRELQQRLQIRGYEVGQADGVFGPKTYAAVLKFQRDQGLLIDGEAGSLTLAALRQ